MGKIQGPYLLYLGNSKNPLTIKMSRGVADWRRHLCIGEYGKHLSLGLEKMTPQEAADRGARSFVLGLINTTGDVSTEWIPTILEAIESGMDVVNGLHQRLSDVNEVKQAADKYGVRLHDIRHEFEKLPIGTGTPRAGHRILTVGTDCSVGKMYTALTIEQEMKSRGYDVDFRATGQTGILISGDGIPIDAVVCDFVAGAAEHLCAAHDDNHWDVIEGQGSLFNPAYAGVSLGLLHGAQADILIMCHEAGRTNMKDKPGYRIPDIADCIETNLKMARLTSPAVTVGAISLNCRVVGQDKADALCQELSDRFSIPCFDPVIHGAAEFVDRLS